MPGTQGRRTISGATLSGLQPVERLTRGYTRAWALGLAALALAGLAIIDVSLPEDANVSGALAVVPFLASTAGTTGAVAILGLASTAVAVGLAFIDGSGLHASVVRILVIAAGTMVAAKVASSRQRRERRLVALSAVADVAQRAIMTTPGPVVGSVAVAVRYQSSSTAAAVGGDCLEALDTRFGTRLLLGDVRGHGLPAVRLSALVLGAFRALGHLEPDLARIAREIDVLLARYTEDADGIELDGEEFVTAIFVQVAQDRVTIANCGHPPPLLLRRDGEVAMLEATRPTVPLALGSQPRLDTITVTPGARLLLYTDGITESRDPDGVFFNLRHAAARLASRPLEPMLDGLLEELRQHTNDQVLDDVALLAFEPPGRLAPTAVERAD